MKLSFKYLRWIFLALYVLVVAVFLFQGLSSDDSDTRLWTAIALVVMVISQAIFIFGTGTIELCKPIKKRRLLLPVIAASFMMAILAGALSTSLAEFFRADADHWADYAFYGVVLVTWLGWGIVFYAYTKEKERFRIIRRLAAAVFTGSLIELLVAVPSHLVVSKRPGCFVGMYTMIGIIAGIYVMLWAFGPGIMMLFLKKR